MIEVRRTGTDTSSVGSNSPSKIAALKLKKREIEKLQQLRLKQEEQEQTEWEAKEKQYQKELEQLRLKQEEPEHLEQLRLGHKERERTEIEEDNKIGIVSDIKKHSPFVSVYENGKSFELDPQVAILDRNNPSVVHHIVGTIFQQIGVFDRDNPKVKDANPLN